MIYLAIIPLALVGYEMIIANSYPKHTRGIIVKYITTSSAEFILRRQWQFRGWHLSLVCCALQLLHFWLPIKAQNPENKSLPRKVKKNSDLNMIDFTAFETNLKKTETLLSNNQHCNEKTTNRWNWTTFAIARNPGNKKSTSQSEKRIVESTWSTLQCLKKTIIKNTLKLYRRVTNIVLKKKNSPEIEQRLLL